MASSRIYSWATLKMMSLKVWASIKPELATSVRHIVVNGDRVCLMALACTNTLMAAFIWVNILMIKSTASGF